jgi:D-aminoacyl-tRNA deacylase
VGEDWSSVLLKTAIICSAKDAAGCNIRDRLIENFDFRETDRSYSSHPVLQFNNAYLATSLKEILHVDDLDTTFENCRCIFISKHRAESGIPSLTAHFTGNFGFDANFGGKPREVGRYSPYQLKTYFEALRSFSGGAIASYEITLEATHHGPTSLAQPLMFAELGSSEVQWEDETAASSVAAAVMKAVDFGERNEKVVIGIGGTHYPTKFVKAMTESKLAFGIIVPKYALENLDEEMLQQIVSKSEQPISAALVDQKGLGPKKEKVIEVLRSTNLEIIFV